jgi:hypothetical protein
VRAVERFGGIDVCVNNASAINLAGCRAAARPVRRPRLRPANAYVNAPIPVMAPPTISVCMVSVPSKVWIASRSAMCQATW